MTETERQKDQRWVERTREEYVLRANRLWPMPPHQVWWVDPPQQGTGDL